MRRSATHARQGNSRMLYSFYSLYREDDSIDWFRKVKRIIWRNIGVPYGRRISPFVGTFLMTGKKEKSINVRRVLRSRILKRNFMRSASKGSESVRDGNKTTKISMKLLFSRFEDCFDAPNFPFPRFSWHFFFTTYIDHHHLRLRFFSDIRRGICNSTKTNCKASYKI